MNLLEEEIIEILSEPYQNKNWHESKWWQDVITICYGIKQKRNTMADSPDELPKIGDKIWG